MAGALRDGQWALIAPLIKAHKIRLNPTPEQAAYFTHCAGVARFVYNWGLAQWKSQYAAGESPSAFKLKKEFNAIKREHYPFVGAVAKDVAEGAFANLAAAFQNFFDSHTGKEWLHRRNARGQDV